MRLNGCLSLGATSPISFWAQIYIFLAVIHLFDIAYLPKSFNHSEKLCKMINYGPKVQRLRNTAGTFYKRHDGVYTYRILPYMEYGKSTHDNEKTPTIMKKHPR